jgi:hypothetical protein
MLSGSTIAKAEGRTLIKSTPGDESGEIRFAKMSGLLLVIGDDSGTKICRILGDL